MGFVYEQDDGQSAIIDSVLGFDPKSGRTRTTYTERIKGSVLHRQLEAQWRWRPILMLITCLPLFGCGANGAASMKKRS